MAYAFPGTVIGNPITTFVFDSLLNSVLALLLAYFVLCRFQVEKKSLQLIVYNALGVPIAAGVLYPITGTLLSPILAGAAMSLSSVSVIVNSLRLGGDSAGSSSTPSPPPIPKHRTAGASCH